MRELCGRARRTRHSTDGNCEAASPPPSLAGGFSSPTRRYSRSARLPDDQRPETRDQPSMKRRDEIREKALRDLQQYEVLMLNGHFDFGNGYHGSMYLNPHQLFRYPSTIWRFAQDLIDVLPASVLDQTQVVAGPADRKSVV